MKPQKIKHTNRSGLSVAYNHSEVRETSTVTLPESGQKSWYQDLFSRDYLTAYQAGVVPSLHPICMDIFRTCFFHQGSTSPLSFISAIQKISWSGSIEAFQNYHHQRLVIMDNEKIKIVLILWNPGETSSIHGHPDGGCVFKVLSGQVAERRYDPKDNSILQSVSTYYKSAIAYLDNRMSYHAVSNESGSPAITIHAYTH